MDFLNLASERYSVRSYSDKKVEKEKLDKILKAALVAPTAVNYQPQKLYVLKSDEALAKIRSITRHTFDAPLVFIICSDAERAWKSRYVENYDSGEMDASIVCTHIMMEAQDLGLGSLWILLFDPAKIKAEFDLPDNIRPHCLLAVGYPSDESKPNEALHNTFRDMSDIVTEL